MKLLTDQKLIFIDLKYAEKNILAYVPVFIKCLHVNHSPEQSTIFTKCSEI